MTTILDPLLHSPFLLYLFATLFSLFIGSFLNVVIYRLPLMLQAEWYKSSVEYLQENSADNAQNRQAVETISKNASCPSQINLCFPASNCPSCGHKIRFWENIPLVSYALLRARCAHCEKPIHWRYPFIEAMTVMLSLLAVAQFGATLSLLFALIFTWALIAAVVIDLEHQLLPDDITLPLMWMGLLISLLPNTISPSEAIWGAVIGYLTLWGVYWLFKLLVGKEGMGYGDFKLLAALGAWLGWSMLPMVILLASVIGSIVGIALLLKGHGRQIPIPFGPYLGFAGWVTLLYGAQMQSFYWSLFH